ncbi:APC family permease [Saccharopolyspora tripterygii]
MVEDALAPSRGPGNGVGAQLLRRKPIADLVADSGQGEGGSLRRSLGLWQLTMLSVGATLGTGIFVVLGEAVPLAGPGVALAFVIAGATALLSALSYAELAGMIPVAGSSYSYAYATMGELAAWVCGWCLMLEYGVSVAVAVGWGQYVNELLQLLVGVSLPESLSAPPGDGGILNLPAAVVVILAMVALLGGARESARVNTAMVLIKTATLVLFCALAFTAVQDGNFSPLLPLGMGGVTAAAGKLFFSYIGFDAASTAGSEARDPQRDLPRAIMLSLALVTVLYCLVALAAVGAMHWTLFEGTEAALSKVLGGTTGSILLSAGAIVAVASVVLTVLYGQTRILFSMSRDGLVPGMFSRVDPRTGVPRANTVLVSVFIAVLSAVVPLGELADATSIGTLFAFALVNMAVVVLRRRNPELPRSFRAPLVPLVPVLGVLSCCYLMFSLGAATWLTFGAWMLAGMAIYFGYGRRRSSLSN